MPLLILVAVVLAVVVYLRVRRSEGGFSLRNPGVRRAGIAVGAVLILVILAQEDDDDTVLEMEREPCPAFHEEDCPSAIDGFTPSTTAGPGDQDEDIPREPCPAYHEEDCPPASTTTTTDPSDVVRQPCPAFREEDCPPVTPMGAD